MAINNEWLRDYTCVNTLRPRRNRRHFADDTFNRIFVDENIRISIKISLKFVPKGPINTILALVQIMAWRRSGEKPLSEPMMVSLPTHICVTRPQWVNTLRLTQNGHAHRDIKCTKGNFTPITNIYNISASTISSLDGHVNMKKPPDLNGIVPETCVMGMTSRADQGHSKNNPGSRWQYKNFGKIFTRPTYKILSGFTVITYVYRSSIQNKFQSDTIIITSDLAVSRLHKIWQ